MITATIMISLKSACIIALTFGAIAFVVGLFVGLTNPNDGGDADN